MPPRPPALAVTGSTGRVGGRVAARLAAAGVPQRLVVRDPGRAPSPPGAELAIASYGEFEPSREALEGIGTLFMVSASESRERVTQHRTFVDAAAAAGVRHLVYLSFYGAAPDATFTLARDHWVTERSIREHDLTWTFVRDNLYLDVLPELADEQGVIRGPAGAGRVAAVAIDDVADVVAAILQDPDAHAGETYSLTGPEALTLDEAAAILRDVTGRAFAYRPETLDEAHASRERFQAAPWQVEAWVSTYTAIANGELADVTDHVERLSGHPPRSLRDVLTASGASS